MLVFKIILSDDHQQKPLTFTQPQALCLSTMHVFSSYHFLLPGKSIKFILVAYISKGIGIFYRTSKNYFASRVKAFPTSIEFIHKSHQF